MRDLIIIGSGSAGLSAAVYARRYLMNTLVIGELTGGLLTTAHLIENWPGIISISGAELMSNIERHAKHLGAEIINDSVISVKKSGDKFIVKTNNKEYESRAVIIATGTIHRRLGVKGEGEYYGKGVSYCAACDGPLFTNQVVGVVGGSDSAAKEAIVLSEYAKKVYIIYRREKLRAEPITLKRVNELINEGKIEVITNTNVTEIIGDGARVTSVKLDNGSELKLNGLFVEIGLIPKTSIAKELGVELNDKGEIIVDMNAKTSINGVFAAGDCTNVSFKQAIIGAAQGVMAAHSAYEYIQGIISQ